MERAKALPPKADEKMKELLLCQAAGPGMTFYNTSRFVNLLFFDDSEALTKKGVIRTLYDPAAGTRGMLSVAQNYLRESYAICMSDTLIKGEDDAPSRHHAR